MPRNPLLAIDVRTDLRRRIAELERAWGLYLRGVQAPSEVRTAIAASWERCLKQGVDPIRTRAVVQVSESEAAARWRESELAWEAGPVLAELSDLLPDSGHLVVVSDASGLLLRVEGDSKTHERAERMNFAPGALWSEVAAGTNAIGTALATGSAIQVLGAEHLCEVVHPWTCSAAPIRDPVTGQTIGVVDVTGLREAVHPHSLLSVLIAARAVEQRLQHRQGLLQLLVQEEYGRVLRQNHAAAVAGLDGGGRVIAHSPALCELAPIDDQGRLAFLSPDVLAAANQGEFYGEVQGLRGERLVLQLRPVRTGNRLAGYILRLWRPVAALRREEDAPVRYSFASLLGHSAPMREVVRRAQIAADHSFPVLITGESGTGKEVLAQAIHAASRRSGRPFVAVNCAAIPGDLLAGELFGYEPGAFTGARREGHAGKFEQAAGGTILLDEIGDMPLPFQAYLLRVLEERQVVRLGGKKPVPLDVRVIAATNVDLEERVRDGRFRADLFYRLAAWRIHLPPLRERAEDVPVLFRSFLSAMRAELGRSPLEPTEEVLALLQAYPWPGNIRELRHVALQVALVAEGPEVRTDDLPAAIRERAEREPAPGEGGQGGPDSAPAPSRSSIRQVLQETGGNISAAARRLGVHRSTLYRWLSRSH